MNSRGSRGKSSMDGWDPMKEDFANSKYHSQIPNESSNGVDLDHNRLYIRGIPTVLNENGLRNIFSKYGELQECYISSDPMKKYGLVRFESPGQAMLAMTTLNGVEPMNLKITIAHMSQTKTFKTPKDKRQKSEFSTKKERWPKSEISTQKERNQNSEHSTPKEKWQKNDSSSQKEKTQKCDSSIEEISESISEIDQSIRDICHLYFDDRVPWHWFNIDSFVQAKIDFTVPLDLTSLYNNNFMDLVTMDDVEEIFYDDDLEMYQEMQKLKIRSSQCHLMYIELMREVSNRQRALRNKTASNLMVCSSNSGRVVFNDVPAIEGCEIDDMMSPPSLLPKMSSACVNNCGVLALMYCSRCGITPYCSRACQIQDWEKRHKSVCHNLATQNIARLGVNKPVVNISESPTPTPLRRPRLNEDTLRTFTPEGCRSRDSDAALETGYKNSPSKHNKPIDRSQQAHDKDKKPYRLNNNNDNNNKKWIKNNQKENRENGNFRGQRPPLKHEEEGTWGSGGNDDEISVKLPKETPKAVQSVPQTTSVATVKGICTTTVLVPDNYLIGILDVGDIITLSVEGVAQECATDVPGVVCLSLHEKHLAAYQTLLDNYSEACHADTNEYRMTPGESFSLFNESDNGWYRARCLSATTAALLDAPKVVTVGPDTKCRRLQGTFAGITEFSCVLQANGVQIGDELRAKIVAKKPDGSVSIKLKGATGNSLGDGKILRWEPKVEVAPRESCTPAQPQKHSVVKAPRQAEPVPVEDTACVVKKLIPETHLTEVLDVGEIVNLSVEGCAKELSSDVEGFVCVSLHEKYITLFETLLGDYSIACNADSEDYRMTPGESFSLFNESDNGWYRARCLSATTAALLDAPKVVTVGPDTKCRRLQGTFAGITEFSCVLQANGVQISDELRAKIVAKKPDGSVSIKLKDAAGNSLGDGKILRWKPKVEVAPRESYTPAQPQEHSVVETPRQAEPVPVEDTACVVKKLIPEKHLTEVLDVGEIVNLSVEGCAKELSSDVEGFVCVSLHEKFITFFEALLGDYSIACNADSENYRMTPGESFSLFNESDNGWYRARCLSATTAALLDAPKVVTVGPDTKCRRLQGTFAGITEFSCVLQANGVQIGDELRAKIVAKKPDGSVSIKLKDAAGNSLGDGKILRWEPKVEVAPRETCTPGVAENVPETPQSAPTTPAVGNTASVASKLVPDKYLTECLSAGDIITLSVEGVAQECATDVPGVVCLSLHEDHIDVYQTLLSGYSEACSADTTEYCMTPGESFSLFNESDNGWYRARCLSATTAALLDAPKVVTVGPDTKCRRLQGTFAGITEFSCVLQANGVQVTDVLQANILLMNSDGSAVVDLEKENVSIGLGKIMRWNPKVESSPPIACTPGAANSTVEIARPDLKDKSTVVIVEVNNMKVLVRDSDSNVRAKYDTIRRDVVVYGMSVTPLEIPPLKGQLVLAKYTDGMHHRALCVRTNVTKDKYLLEYIENGKTEVVSQKMLYPCPDELSLVNEPAITSCVTLPLEMTPAPEAIAYLEHLKENMITLVLTLQNGEKTAPSGSEAVLTIEQSRENINKKIQDMSTPEWKKMELNGEDLYGIERTKYVQMQHVRLPMDGGVLRILDTSLLAKGYLGACELGDRYIEKIFGQLTQDMRVFCESEYGGRPYLPSMEEICIVKCPDDGAWCRATYCKPTDGPGSDHGEVLYIDYGNIGVVPVSDMRIIPTEFVKAAPALACDVSIKGLPNEIPLPAVEKAKDFMGVDEHGMGTLRVTKCMFSNGAYVVEAPELMEAIKHLL